MNMINEMLPDLRLRLNIEHPALEECYVLGYESAMAKMDESENPFRKGTLESEQWFEGWWSGFYNEEPTFKLVKEPVSAKPAKTANDDNVASRFEVLVKILEITGVIAASAFLGYQMVELVA